MLTAEMSAAAKTHVFEAYRNVVAALYCLDGVPDWQETADRAVESELEGVTRRLVDRHLQIDGVVDLEALVDTVAAVIRDLRHAATGTQMAYAALSSEDAK